MQEQQNKVLKMSNTEILAFTTVMALYDVLNVYL